MTGYLRRARIAAGMSQRELGEAAELDDTSVSLYERGKARPSPAARRRLEDALDRGLVAQLEEIHSCRDELQRERASEASASGPLAPEQPSVADVLPD